MAGTWCIAAFLLVNYYNSLFISFLTIPTHETPINTFEELAQSTALSVAVEKGSAMSELVLVF